MHTFLKSLAFLALAFPLLVACARTAPQPEALSSPITPEPTAAAVQEQVNALQNISADQVGLQAEADEDEVDHCLDCHTDQQRLIDTAKPQEQVASESSGEG